MVMIVKNERPNSVKLEDGWYVGRLTKVNEGTNSKGAYIRFVFQLEGVEPHEVSASYITGTNLTPGSKLDMLLRTFGVNTDIGDAVDTDELAARGVRAKVLVEPKENAEGRVFHNVSKVKAVTQPSAAPVAQEVSAPAVVAAAPVVAPVAAPARAVVAAAPVIKPAPVIRPASPVIRPVVPAAQPAVQQVAPVQPRREATSVDEIDFSQE